MQKNIVTLAALLATAGLIFWGVHFPGQQREDASKMTLVRVWVEEQDTQVWKWLRRQAKRFEKEKGIRVYLRSSAVASAKPASVLPPDLVISSQGENKIAAHGYAIFVRDDRAGMVSPRPTSLLFFRPTPSPGPSLTPEPAPDFHSFSAVLVPDKLLTMIPNGIRSEYPLEEFGAGKAEAAVLTVEQAGQLSFRFRLVPLPRGKSSLSVFALPMTTVGKEFMQVLLSASAQADLTDVGLYSFEFQIYRGIDPVRELIENSL